MRPLRVSREDDTYFYRIVDGDSKGKPSANGMLTVANPSHDLKNADEIVFGPQVRLTLCWARYHFQQGHWMSMMLH